MSILSKLFNRKELPMNAGQNESISGASEIEPEFEDMEDSDPDVDWMDLEPSETEPEETEPEYEIVEREIHPTKIICPDCGGLTLEGLEFCDKCGGELL